MSGEAVMRDYGAIRDLRARGLSIRDMARRTGLSRNTIRRAVRTTPEVDFGGGELDWSQWPLRGTIQLPGGTLTIEVG